MWRLATEADSLEANSAYSYLMLSEFFPETCIVAEDDGAVVGFVTGFRPPEEPEALFVWQITVAPSQRGRGLARTMLEALVERLAPRGVRYLQATVTPSNIPSQRTFRSLARRLGAACEETTLFAEHLFGEEDHEEEVLFRIGPFRAEQLRPQLAGAAAAGE